MLVEVKNLAKSFGDRELFSELNFTFKPAEVNVILGESGSGKSTLLNIIGLFEDADDGEVLYDGNVVSSLPTAQRRKVIRETTGYIYQDIRLFEELSVVENIRLALRFSAEPRRDWNARSHELLARLGMEELTDKPAKLLSGGEKQRIAIARALAANKKLILADEPTGALDELNSKVSIDLLQEACDQDRCTIVLVTHSQLVAHSFSNRRWLEHGQLLDRSEHREG